MTKAVIIILVIAIAALGSLVIFTQGKKQTLSEIIPTSTMQQKNMIEKPTDAISANKAIIETNKGTIELELYSSDAPKTVMNFATLAKRGYYNGLTFHRVEPGFVIQGGDPNGNGTGGKSIYGETFEDELDPDTKSYQAGYNAGVLAMANRGSDTNGSQFFIMLEDNPSLPKAYTIFGKVTKGIDVVRKIEIGDDIESITAE